MVNQLCRRLGKGSLRVGGGSDLSSCWLGQPAQTPPPATHPLGPLMPPQAGDAVHPHRGVKNVCGKKHERKNTLGDKLRPPLNWRGQLARAAPTGVRPPTDLEGTGQP